MTRDVSLVCSGGCGVVTPLMVSADSRCLGCGSPVAVTERPDVVRALLQRASGLFTPDEQEALQRLALGSPIRKTTLIEGTAPPDEALVRAREKMTAILELRDALLTERAWGAIRR